DQASIPEVRPCCAERLQLDARTDRDALLAFESSEQPHSRVQAPVGLIKPLCGAIQPRRGATGKVRVRLDGEEYRTSALLYLSCAGAWQQRDEHGKQRQHFPQANVAHAQYDCR